MYWHDGSPGAWVAMTVMMIVFWGAIVAAIVVLVRALPARRREDLPTASEAGHILDERFARGDIDADEYRRRHEVLRGK